MEPDFFGTEQVTEEDRAYRGSRFSEVRDAPFANPLPEGLGCCRRTANPDLRREPGDRVAGGAANWVALLFSSGGCDEGSTKGPNFFQRRTLANWQRIGRLVFDNAVVSYNGDFLIHFTHPTWRDDRNDPSTATRVGERKAR